MFGTYTHKIILCARDTTVAKADLVYMNYPFPFYYLFFLKVEKEYRSLGYGSFLIENVNHFLSSRGKMGILRNIIDPQSAVCSIYEKHSWMRFTNESPWFLYNKYKKLDNNDIRKAIHAIKILEEEAKFYFTD